MEIAHSHKKKEGGQKWSESYWRQSGQKETEGQDSPLITGNLSPAEGMILGKDGKVKEECQERDIKIIKRVSAHCLTEVSPTPSWTCSTQPRGPCAMSNVHWDTRTRKHTGANAHACRHPTTALHRRAADIIRSPVIPERSVHSSLKVHFNLRADLTGSLGSLRLSINTCTLHGSFVVECSVFGGEKKNAPQEFESLKSTTVYN